MHRNLLATGLVSLMTLMFVTPVDATPDLASAPAEVTLGACGGYVVGASGCTFSCTEGSTIVVNFFGSGSVIATCGGGAAACATPTTSVNCKAIGTKAVFSSEEGICAATGVGFFNCGG